MLLPSLAITLSLGNLALASSSPSFNVRRDAAGSAAGTALVNALTLNNAIAYYICTIAKSSFQAVAALGGNQTFSGVCSTNAAIPSDYPSIQATGTIVIDGCIGTTNGINVAAAGCAFGLQVDESGTLLPLETGPTFSTASSNGLCAGIRNPFMLDTPAKQLGHPFIMNSWNINCTTMAITLNNPGHLCICSDGVTLYTTSDPTCSVSFNVIFSTDPPAK